MKKLSLVTIFVVFLLACLYHSVFALEFFGGKLHEVKGSIQQTLNYRTHQDERSVKFSSFRTTFRIEGLYDLITQPCWDVKLYGLFNYWYDNATNIDHDLEDAIRLESGGSHGLRAFRRANEQEEILRELYFEIKRGATFKARLGKQLVSWGETAESRVADLINPLDLANMLAFPDWEDFKVGLWMGRFFFTPQNMWQDLSFELIVIPPDFQYNRFPPAGSGLYFGTPQGLTVPLIFRTFYWPDAMEWQFNKMRHDAPANTWSNTEVGMRIRGNTWGADWTLSHFYTRLDSPILDGMKGATNFQNKLFNEMNKQLGVPPFKRKVGRVFTYPHYQSTAITFSKPWDWAKSVIRGEVVLNSDRDYNQTVGQVTKVVERELLTTAISWDRNNMVPYLSYWNRSRSVSTSLTWYHYRLFGWDRNISWEAGKDQPGPTTRSYWNKISLSMETGFYYDTIYPVFNFAYDCNTGSTVFAGAIRFAPGDHWRWLVIYQQINEAKSSAGKDMGRYQDQVIFSMRYEF